MKKLSELMREGAKRYPQARGQFVSVDAEGKICKACALGGAALIAGVNVPALVTEGRSPIKRLSEVSGIDLHKPLPKHQYPLWREIAHKNDTDSTIEDIADWLESLGL